MAKTRQPSATSAPPKPFSSVGLSNEQEKLLVTAAEAAHMLSMGKSTFWREVATGNLPSPIKIGGITRWSVDDLRSFIRHASKNPGMEKEGGAV